MPGRCEAGRAGHKSISAGGEYCARCIADAIQLEPGRVPGNATGGGEKDLQPSLPPTQHRPDVLNLAATLYEDTGDTSRAVSLLRQAIIGNPRDTELYLHFADVCFVHKSFQVGIDMLNAGLT